MNEMIERIARAIHATKDDMTVYPWWHGNVDQCRLSRALARAAITAMREPTDGMVIAGCHHENLGDMAGRWQAMIDKALE